MAGVADGGVQAPNEMRNVVEVPEGLVAEMAAQYDALAVSPVRVIDTLWDVPSVNPSGWALVEFVGEPLLPLVAHQVELERA